MKCASWELFLYSCSIIFGVNIIWYNCMKSEVCSFVVCMRDCLVVSLERCWWNPLLVACIACDLSNQLWVSQVICRVRFLDEEVIWSKEWNRSLKTQPAVRESGKPIEVWLRSARGDGVVDSVFDCIDELIKLQEDASPFLAAISRSDQTMAVVGRMR